MAIQPVQWLIAESPVNSPKAAAVESPEGQILPKKSILGIAYHSMLNCQLFEVDNDLKQPHPGSSS